MKLVYALIVILACGIGFYYYNQYHNQATAMKITTTAFKEGDYIPKIYTCKGDNVNPPLQLSNIPTQAKTLVIIVDDPDAPGGTFDHWLIWNIDPKTSQIAENSVPHGGIQGINGFGSAKYQGPCPPSGNPHTYYFRLYALDTELNLIPGANKTALLQAMQGHIITEAQYTGKQVSL